MRQAHNTNGYSIIEVLAVISIMMTVLAIGTSFISWKAAKRRSVDGVTNNVLSMLQTGKLMSVRDGVEYRVVFASCDDVDDTDPDCPKCDEYVEYQAGDKDISLIMERGDSNSGSTVWCMQSEHSKRFQSDLDITASANLGGGGEPLNFAFVPTGMRRDFGTDINNETLTIKSAEDSNIDNCGQIRVSPAGGISATEGRWDGTQCNPILDQAVPTSPPSPGPG
ncbi:MAG TPA: hypothetical protein VJV40_04630 [Thermodesulfobacteriota bacterium]|nr:hypothetical protein [Thermodesulfobacteriota bacterium]